MSKALKDNECTHVEELIANGADVNQASVKGTRPLQHAAKTGCTRCVTLLLNRGADIQATATIEAPSAVSIAASNGHQKALKCLLNKCTDKSIIDGKEEKQAPLHYACFNGKIDVLRCIIEKYPRIIYVKTSANAKYCTLLHVAAESDSVKCVEVLLECGAELGATDVNGATALTCAARRGKLAAVQFLHDRRASAFAVNRKHWLPLHNACSNGHVDVARYLVEKHPSTVNFTTTEEHGC